MKTRITELLNIEYPIVQGAMAWVADADLASAVSNAGGLGVIGTGHDPVESVREKVEDMYTKTNKPFAINVMLLSAHADDVVDYIINESGVKVITTGAGDPSKYMERFKEAGIAVIPVIASVAHAKRMARIGASALIVEGTEAGGHIGRTTTMALVPQVCSAVDLPVIAAGGIGDGRGMAAAFMLGAEGIQVGTRFVVSTESNAHENFKRQILRANDIATVTTGNASGHPVRVLRNKLTKEYARIERELAGEENPDITPLEELGRGALKKVVVDGDTDWGSMMAGQIAGLINEEQSCDEIIQDYINGAYEVYKERRAFFE